MLPFPGTPDVAAGTNIDFPAISPAQIAWVRVVGSRSGVHAGHLSAQPDHAGTAFSPSRPFTAGERVSVTATLRSAAAGTASGAPDARGLRFSFSVARPVHIAESNQSDAGASSGGKTHSFVTEPSWHVPWIQTNGTDTDTSSGYIFLDAQVAPQNAAYMLNGKGKLLWYHPTASTGAGPATRLTRVEHYGGHPVIIYWQGRYLCPPCGGEGAGYMLNDHYKVIHTIKAGDGYQDQGTDLHEFTLGKGGVAWVQIWKPVQANLRSVGGPSNGTVFDWIIQEINVATNKVLWEWQSLGHVPIDQSYERYVPGQPYDYFHLNSIQELSDGRVLISARHTWTIYSIIKKTGRIAWRLGGKHSSFRVGAGTRFYWQHDAQLHGGGLLTVFDDGATPKEENQSRALEIHLGNGEATLVHAYTHSPSVLATAAGSVEILPNNNVFVGWGEQPDFSEYTQSGKQIFSDGFVRPIESYRAYRDRWTGHPTSPPAVVVRKASKANQFNVYASWNGATQVKHWQVLGATSSSGPFKPIRRALWASFETQIPISTGDSYFKVEAEGAKYNVLPHGTSGVVQAGS